MKPKDLELAYEIWRTNFHQFRIDRHPPHETVGWIRSVREAYGMTATELAQILNSHASACTRMERAEVEGKITIEALRNVSEALGCEFTYSFKKKDGGGFSKSLWERIAPEAQTVLARRRHPQAMLSHALAAIATDLLRNPKARRKLKLPRVF